MKQKLFLTFFATAFALCSWANGANIDGINYVLISSNKTASVTFIGNAHSGNNTYTGNVVIPETVTYGGTTYSVTSIGYEAFYGCTDLTSITIPNSVTSIAEHAFDGCSGLMSIAVDAANTVYDSREDCNAIIETSTNALIVGCSNSVIPSTVSVIRSYAFCEYDSLKITFKGITPPVIEEYAFGNLQKTYATVPVGSLSAYSSIGFKELVDNYNDFLVITLTEAGTLQDKIIDTEETDIRELKISGPITASDIKYLRENVRLANLAYLDISEVTLVPSDEPYAILSDYTPTDFFRNASGTMSSSTVRFYIAQEEMYELYKSGNHALGGGYDIYNYFSKSLAAAFQGMKLRKIILPPSFDRIGAFCFMKCENLEDISLPNMPVAIDAFAFYGCKSLKNVIFPESVLSIGNWAFAGCVSLSEIGKLDNVVSIGEGTFSGCVSFCLYGAVNLKNFDIIPNSAFYNCKRLRTVTFSDKLKRIGDYAFTGTALSEVQLPECTEAIGLGAFGDCTNLTSINCPSALLQIGHDTFKNTPFSKTLEVEDHVCYWNQLAIAPKDLDDNTITIRNGTKSIADWFITYSEVNKINLPETLLRIGDYSLCRSRFSNIEFPEGLQQIGKYAFYETRGDLTSLTIPESVSYIGEAAFYGCQKLVLLNYLANSRDINMDEGYIFSGCNALEKLRIGSKVEKIPDYAFSSKSQLYKVIFDQRTDGTPLHIGKVSFRDCSKISGEILLPEGTTIIGENAFAGCTGLTSVTIPNSVTNIGSSAFNGCTGLTSITIPESVTSIEEYTFCGCKGLTSITIPESVTSIGENAFVGCTGLTSITIPNSVTSIGDYAFSDCSSVTSVNACRINPAKYNCSGRAFFTFPTSTCTLSVPYGSKDAYSSTSPWSMFANIVEGIPASINKVDFDNAVFPKKVYDIQGRTLSEPQQGLNIIRYSDGTSKKVLVK